MRLPPLPHETLYYLARLDQHRQRTRNRTHQRAGQRGSVTLEWMVIAGVLFLAAVAAGAKIVSAINEHSSKIK